MIVDYYGARFCDGMSNARVLMLFLLGRVSACVVGSVAFVFVCDTCVVW